MRDVTPPPARETDTRIILASASPRRAELLHAAGFAFEVVPGDADERTLAGEGPFAYVRRVAQAKAAAVAGRHPGRLVLAADTTVVLGTRILGKPTDREDAARMLCQLAGREHLVMTAVALAGAREALDVDVTRVTFAPMRDDDIAAYVASGEPMDKAGAYGIQGLASRFVERIEGSYSNVVGLPIALVHRLLTTPRP